jgi:hypothetical protein
MDRKEKEMTITWTISTLVLLVLILICHNEYNNYNVSAFGRQQYLQQQRRYIKEVNHLIITNNDSKAKQSSTSLAFGNFFSGVGNKVVNIPKNMNDR